MNKKKEKRVDEGALKRRQEYCNIEVDDLGMPTLEDRYIGAVKE